MVLTLKSYMYHLSAVHSEKALCVFGGIEFSELLFSFARNVRDGQPDDFIDPIVLNLQTVEGDQIVVFIVPHQAPGTDLIPGAIAPEFLLFTDCPLKILEADLPVGINCFMQHINIIVDALIHGFDPVGYQYLTVKMLGLVNAHHGFQLLNQLTGFLFRDEFRGLYRIDEQFQLRKFKGTRGQMIINLSSNLLLQNLQSEFFQSVEVCIECFPVRVNSVSGEFGRDLLQGKCMGVISFLGKNLDKIEHFELLIITGSHRSASRI